MSSLTEWIGEKVRLSPVCQISSIPERRSIHRRISPWLGLLEIFQVRQICVMTYSSSNDSEETLNQDRQTFLISNFYSKFTSVCLSAQFDLELIWQVDCYTNYWKVLVASNAWNCTFSWSRWVFIRQIKTKRGFFIDCSRIIRSHRHIGRR